MKTSEIEVGRTYSNGKEGRRRAVRRVLDMGPQYKLYESQFETRCLAYAIVEGRQEHLDRGRTPDGLQIQHSTIASFAAWAKDAVPGVKSPLTPDPA